MGYPYDVINYISGVIRTVQTGIGKSHSYESMLEMYDCQKNILADYNDLLREMNKPAVLEKVNLPKIPEVTVDKNNIKLITYAVFKVCLEKLCKEP